MNRAVCLLAALAVVCGALAPVAGQVVSPQFYVDRDNCNNSYPTEVPCNRGAVAWIRAARGDWDECYYGDFDVATITQWVTDNPLGENERYKFEFFIYPTSSWPNDDDPAGYTAELWTLNLLHDWEEGDATGAFAPYNWAAGVPAATDWYAQHVWYLDPQLFIPVDDVDNCVSWTDEAGAVYSTYSGNDALHKFQNSQSFWANFESYLSYVSVELDEQVWQDLLYNEYNRGLALKGTDVENYENYNSTIYAKEQNNPSQEPYLQVSIVPTLPIPGDTNDDGWVDGADYTNWADNYLSSPVPAWEDGGWTVGNFNADDTVDGADYTVWADNYNPPPPGGAVPEPATLVLIALGAGAVLRRRRR